MSQAIPLGCDGASLLPDKRLPALSKPLHELPRTPCMQGLRGDLHVDGRRAERLRQDACSGAFTAKSLPQVPESRHPSTQGCPTL
jgi:hypothetical protein